MDKECWLSWGSSKRGQPHALEIPLAGESLKCSVNHPDLVVKTPRSGENHLALRQGLRGKSRESTEYRDLHTGSTQ